MGLTTHSRSVEALEMVKEGQTQTGLPKCWCSVQFPWTAAYTTRAMRNGKDQRIFWKRQSVLTEFGGVHSTMKHLT